MKRGKNSSKVEKLWFCCIGSKPDTLAKLQEFYVLPPKTIFKSSSIKKLTVRLRYNNFVCNNQIFRANSAKRGKSNPQNGIFYESHFLIEIQKAESLHHCINSSSLASQKWMNKNCWKFRFWCHSFQIVCQIEIIISFSSSNFTNPEFQFPQFKVL